MLPGGTARPRASLCTRDCNYQDVGRLDPRLRGHTPPGRGRGPHFERDDGQRTREVYAARDLRTNGRDWHCRCSLETSRTAEGLNSKIQWIRYTARGFRNRENFKTAIYFHCGGLDLYPH